MLKLRPHFHKSVSELQHVFDACTRDRTKLMELLRELRHRATPTAQALQRRVEAALRRLPPEVRRDASAFAFGSTDRASASKPAQASASAASASSADTGASVGDRAVGHKMPATYQSRCLGCQVELRIAVRAPRAVYGCPRCQREFELAWRDSVFHIEWAPVAADDAVVGAPMNAFVARQILAVAPHDDAQAIKQAWRRACQRYHPDKHAQRPDRLQREAVVSIQRINAAYDFLLRGKVSAGR